MGLVALEALAADAAREARARGAGLSSDSESKSSETGEGWAVSESESEEYSCRDACLLACNRAMGERAGGGSRSVGPVTTARLQRELGHRTALGGRMIPYRGSHPIY